MKTKTFFVMALDNTKGSVSALLPRKVLYVTDQWHTAFNQWLASGLTDDLNEAQHYTRRSDAYRGAGRFLNDTPKAMRNTVLASMQVMEFNVTVSVKATKARARY